MGFNKETTHFDSDYGHGNQNSPEHTSMIDFDKLQTDAAKIEHNPITGAKRESKSGKGRFDLIPYHSLFRLARHYENGAVLHGDRNWEAGLPLVTYWNSACRHLNQWKEGDNTEDHLAAAAWNIFGLMHHEDKIMRGELPIELCTFPSRIQYLTPKVDTTSIQQEFERRIKETLDKISEAEPKRPIGIIPGRYPNELIMLNEECVQYNENRSEYER